MKSTPTTRRPKRCPANGRKMVWMGLARADDFVLIIASSKKPEYRKLAVATLSFRRISLKKLDSLYDIARLALASAKD